MTKTGYLAVSLLAIIPSYCFALTVTATYQVTESGRSVLCGIVDGKPAALLQRNGAYIAAISQLPKLKKTLKTAKGQRKKKLGAQIKTIQAEDRACRAGSPSLTPKGVAPSPSPTPAAVKYYCTARGTYKVCDYGFCSVNEAMGTGTAPDQTTAGTLAVSDCNRMITDMVYFAILGGSHGSKEMLCYVTSCGISNQ